ncbi:MAG: glycine cleavage system aminomethyltransferase GcvT [Candidatus Heimdallarchaeum aukensis]|uniref:aminomethyltransferase n=1 Tax=Candidatus Heimdallarchaeum aukensis TaxID=2876573 RepID=A0A9Y1BIP0_9ARCH|nr:MAG: glycine cleavage system aminomethyltransferase GcvT [Candidatus Heimdallarchaeum aukensis]
MTELKKTPMWKIHEEAGARMIDFSGYYLPVSYTGIDKEIMATRENVSIVEVSDMGRYEIKGKHAYKIMEMVTPRDIQGMSDMKCGYTYYLNERGGYRDDTIIGKLNNEHFFNVCNAGSQTKKVLAWVKNFVKIVEDLTGEPHEFIDWTEKTTMFAVQGPNYKVILDNLGVPDTGRWKIVEAEVEGAKCLFTGTGYTGEMGFEVTIFDSTVENPEKGIKVWNAILKAGEEVGIALCGLGARDALRIEAGLPLYGEDIHEDVNPIEAGYDFPVFMKVDKEPWFFGKEAILKAKEEGVKIKHVGIILLEKGISRAGYDILNQDGEKIGYMCNGVRSPIMNAGVGMGYVDIEYSKPGTELFVQIRKKQVPAKVSKLPFYDTSKWGWKRNK